LAKGNYDNNSIRALEKTEQVRLKPAVIFGSNDINGCIQSIFEILSNSIDEAREGYGDNIELTIHKDNSITVKDHGRGVPMAMNRKEGKYNFELVFDHLYAGGKYNSKDYTYSLGTNGLGATATNYASQWFKVESIRDGKKYSVEFNEGVLVGKMKSEPCKDPTGTTISFLPDLDVFTDIIVDKQIIIDTLKSQAIVNAGLTFKFKDEREKYKETFCYPEGVLGYAKELAGDTPLTDPIHFTFEGSGKDRADKPNYKVKGEVVAIFNNKHTDSLYFHNSSPLLYGGSPRRAREKALMEFFKTELKKTDNNRAKELEFDDIQDSKIFISNTFSTETSYENQTKRAINNKFIEDFLTQQITKYLKEWAKEKPMELDKVTNQVSINIQSRKSASAQKLATKQKLTNKIKLDDRIKNFVDCRNKDPENRELFIAEGLSAMGSLKQARNGESQALLAIRGKILNTLKTDYNTIFKNELIMDIMKLVGTGVEMKGKGKNNIGNFDIDNRRFDKIIIATDQDVDGLHIISLCLTLFYKLTPELIKQGHIYFLDTPLYEIQIQEGKNKGKMKYAFTDQEMLEMTKDIKCKVSRNKGLGEVDYQTMAIFMAPATRHLTQVTMEDAKEAEKILELFMGSDSADRKEYITLHGKEYTDLDLE